MLDGWLYESSIEEELRHTQAGMEVVIITLGDVEGERLTPPKGAFINGR